MKTMRWAASGMTLTAVAALTLVSSSAPAQALPQGSCGGSYRKVATYQLTEGAKGGKSFGTVSLYQSPTAHRKCIISRVATEYIGKTKYLYADLFIDRNKNKKYDAADTGVASGSEKYKWFAGPVFVEFADKLCVRFSGAVRIGTKPLVRGGTPEGKWKHCG
ncbi:hypothetical protein [Spongiactinospora sp. TRM90649]|uniref:hypothetical protein n=1 Tax=Spongiactinospora sp. TRM90649 TaxID=3031114 RepID=UPI0023F9DA6E|nr:hypothetical protein [Spongiactinospora sp. TRM90649]MDF5757512.1 hypothetical protein [Spongiactinospora sp. TRM90649]